MLPLQGHYKQILSMDFHSNGHILSSGSQDNSIKVWDLRFKGAVATIPSHLKLVSDLKFERGQSRFLLSSGYDGTVRVYSSVDWTQKLEVQCGQEKLSSVNILSDCSKIFATSIEKKLHTLSLKSLANPSTMQEED